VYQIVLALIIAGMDIDIDGSKEKCCFCSCK